jgi:hypothetical protein
LSEHRDAASNHDDLFKFLSRFSHVKDFLPFSSFALFFSPFLHSEATSSSSVPIPGSFSADVSASLTLPIFYHFSYACSARITRFTSKCRLLSIGKLAEFTGSFLALAT